ncbi:hypothetical protein [Xanthomonas hortorum]|uniref:hypothetical protein n=1 Tax=Xanthomonas hortorum TaxID=56454 RepID=UPI0015D5F638|nr:hypothetical protein [Xanthomonas hortorum]MCE4357986.1 hypothetical protein [Xanthomonas hortorum pv. taraxaci]NMI51227.1 hypothetical protein [Xanthomonas hortorum pv. taraxaci]
MIAVGWNRQSALLAQCSSLEKTALPFWGSSLEKTALPFWERRFLFGLKNEPIGDYAEMQEPSISNFSEQH